MKASCSGCSAAPRCKPSTVLIFFCCACTANIKQDRTGAPSTSTVQAPQTPCSQPICVPVKPAIVADDVGQYPPRLDSHFIARAVDVENDIDLVHQDALAKRPTDKRPHQSAAIRGRIIVVVDRLDRGGRSGSRRLEDRRFGPLAVENASASAIRRGIASAPPSPIRASAMRPASSR